MTLAVTHVPSRPWRTHPRETVAAVALGAAAVLALASVSGATPTLPGTRPSQAAPAAPPALSPLEVRILARETAVEINRQIPLASGPNPAARPFDLGETATEARSRALECLTSAIYYEAGRESADGQRAVAQVVLNRVRHPAFPNSVCGVVYEGSTRVTGCQFTFTCDGSMAYRPDPTLWQRARIVAWEMMRGRVYAPVGNATHYHADYVVPYWASSLVKTSVEGVHIFYRWAGGWGRPAAFNDRWSGLEGNPHALRLAALSAPRNAAPARSAEATVARLEEAGANVTTGANGRVRVLFTPEAREAVERVKVIPYVERTAASDNLRFALEGGSKDAEQPAFGPAVKEAVAETAAQ